MPKDLGMEFIQGLLANRERESVVITVAVHNFGKAAHLDDNTNQVPKWRKQDAMDPV